jgi:hypothetical protein
MELNETREWPKDLAINGVNVINFHKKMPTESLALSHSFISKSEDKPKAEKKQKKKSRIEQWAEKMASFKSETLQKAKSEKINNFAGPISNESKPMPNKLQDKGRSNCNF